MIPGPPKGGHYVLSLLLLVLTLAGPANAQLRSHGYVSLGAGATGLSGGADVLLAEGPFGIGAEIGAGNLLMASLNGSYHPFDRRPVTKVNPFVAIGLTGLASSERSLTGVSAWGGIVYWPRRRLGLRLDGFKFLTVTESYDVPLDQLSRAHYWGIRAGVSFQLR